MNVFGQQKAPGFFGEEQHATVSVPSEIAQNLKVADENAAFKYDESARNIVAQKSVLAYILKSALDEYVEYTVQEIAERFIGGEPELREIAVHQDHPDRKDNPETRHLLYGENDFLSAGHHI